MSALTMNQKALLIDRVKKEFEKAKEIWPNVDFPEPIISFKLSGRTAGWAQYATSTIKLNPDIAFHNYDKFIERTPGHEAAHIISYACFGQIGRGHGIRWKRVMQLLGYTPSRCHRYDMKNVKVRRQERFTYKCACDTFKFSKTRHNKNIKFRIENGRDRYNCSSCKEKVTLVN